jgi:hypothetical protein
MPTIAKEVVFDRMKFAAFLLVANIPNPSNKIDLYDFIIPISRFFNQLSKSEVEKILAENKAKPADLILNYAALSSMNFGTIECMRHLNQNNFPEKACHIMLESGRLTATEIIQMLKGRLEKVGATSIGPLIAKAIQMGRFTDEELITFLTSFPELGNFMESYAESVSSRMLDYIFKPL